MPKATPLTYYVSIKATPAPLLAKQTTQPKRCTSGSVEALVSTDARSDHAVLDFLVTFFIKKKGKTRTLCKRLHLMHLHLQQHSKQIYVTLYLSQILRLAAYNLYQQLVSAYLLLYTGLLK